MTCFALTRIKTVGEEKGYAERGESRRQKAEKQKAESRRQKADGRKQKAATQD
jgi:hypothetical protein